MKKNVELKVPRYLQLPEAKAKSDAIYELAKSFEPLIRFEEESEHFENDHFEKERFQVYRGSVYVFHPDHMETVFKKIENLLRFSSDFMITHHLEEILSELKNK